jgi:hypothetical protein
MKIADIIAYNQPDLLKRIEKKYMKSEYKIVDVVENFPEDDREFRMYKYMMQERKAVKI